MEGRSNRSLEGFVLGLCTALAIGTGLLLVSATTAHAAGNVTVTVDDEGNLIVTGDDQDNCVEINPFDVGEGDVRGCDSTLVNGGESAPFSGADDDFRFNMGQGNDTVLVDNGDGDTAPDDLEINTSSGDDLVSVRVFAVLDDLEISTGSGNDLVLVDRVAVHDTTRIQTGSGTDCTVFGDLTPASATQCPTGP